MISPVNRARVSRKTWSAWSVRPPLPLDVALERSEIRGLNRTETRTSEDAPYGFSRSCAFISWWVHLTLTTTQLIDERLPERLGRGVSETPASHTSKNVELCAFLAKHRCNYLACAASLRYHGLSVWWLIESGGARGFFGKCHVCEGSRCPDRPLAEVLGQAAPTAQCPKQSKNKTVEKTTETNGKKHARPPTKKRKPHNNNTTNKNSNHQQKKTKQPQQTKTETTLNTRKKLKSDETA